MGILEAAEPEFDEEMMAALALSQQDGAGEGDAKMSEIISFLRDALPLSALAPDETMTIPKGDHYEGYTEQNTLHVDEFLYTDEEAQELTDAGRLPQDYCGNCGSHDIKHLSTYFNHFRARLPHLNSESETFVSVYLESHFLASCASMT